MYEKWEYLTRFVEAEATDKQIKAYIKDTFDKKPKKYSPESMIPQLNQLGAEGWEVISMTPVAEVGGKEDILITGDERKWSHVFFCVFKRRRADSALPVIPVGYPAQQQQPTHPQQPAPPQPAPPSGD